MGDYLPDQPAIDINAVIYRYRVEKQTEDPFVVHIQNKDTQSDGYIFRETDDWSGLPSASINKFVPVPNLPASRFGEGSIETEGQGTVSNQSVIYNYRIDLSEVTPETAPVEIPKIDTNIDIYNVLEDELVSSEQAEVEPVDEEENEDERKDEERQERALRAARNAVGIGTTTAQQMMFTELTKFTLDSYVNLTIDGGVYPEDQTLKDSKLPDSRQGLRNGLAQQVLHTRMVDSQY